MKLNYLEFRNSFHIYDMKGIRAVHSDPYSNSLLLVKRLGQVMFALAENLLIPSIPGGESLQSRQRFEDSFLFE